MAVTTRRAFARHLAAIRDDTALHEAAHAVIGLVLGIPVDVASIRPGESFLGVALSVRVQAELGRLDYLAPACLQPQETRAAIENRIILLLAGDASAIIRPLHIGPAAGYDEPSPVDAEVAAVIDGLAALSPGLAGRLHAAEAEVLGEDGSDAARAFDLADGLNGHTPRISGAYLGYLVTVAEELVRRHRLGIRAVAEELRRREVLTGPDIAEVFYAVGCFCHERPPTALAAGATDKENPNMKLLPTRPIKVDPKSRWAVTTGFSMDLNDVPAAFSPPVGSVWSGAHPGVIAMLQGGGGGKYLVPADSTEEEIVDARRRAADFAISDVEPEPVVAVPRRVKCVTRLTTSIPQTAEVGSPPMAVIGVEVGDELDADHWIARAFADRFAAILPE